MNDIGTANANEDLSPEARMDTILRRLDAIEQSVAALMEDDVDDVDPDFGDDEDDDIEPIVPSNVDSGDMDLNPGF